MSRLKRLIGEIHKRSLWQVLLVYLGVSWGVLEAAALFRDEFGLPAWLVSAALVLLIAGLVVVLVLAFVPEPAASPEEPHEVQRTGAGRRHLLTWRRAATIFVVALAAWGVVTTGWLVFGERGGEAPTAFRAVAVLPLENLSPDPDNEFFAAGIHEDILSQLAKIRALRVISRTSVLRYADTDKDIPTIAEELGVDGVVEGSLRREGNQIRVVLQLIDRADGHLWSETYDRDLTVANVFAIQSDIAEHIAQALRAEMTPEERQRIEASPTDNIEAYDYYLRGKEFYRIPGISRVNYRSAERMFEQAVELDPSFALAHAWLSIVHGLMYWYRYDDTDDRLQDMRAAADRALELDPELPDAHLALGVYYYWGHREYDRALAALSRAEQGRPGDGEVHLMKGAIYRRQGKWEEGIEALKRAALLDPRNAEHFFELGDLHAHLRRYDEAESYYDQALAVEPEYRLAALNKGRVNLFRDGSPEPLRALRALYPEARATVDILYGDYEAALEAVSGLEAEIISFPTLYYPKPLLTGLIHDAAGQGALARAAFDSARVILEAAVSERPDDERRHSALGLAYAGLGLKEAALREGRLAVELLPLSKDAYILGTARQVALARIYAMVGEYDAAIDQLDYLLSIPSGLDISVPQLRIDRMWYPLRDHPRFQALLDKHE